MMGLYGVLMSTIILTSNKWYNDVARPPNAYTGHNEQSVLRVQTSNIEITGRS